MGATSRVFSCSIIVACFKISPFDCVFTPPIPVTAGTTLWGRFVVVITTEAKKQNASVELRLHCKGACFLLLLAGCCFCGILGDQRQFFCTKAPKILYSVCQKTLLLQKISTPHFSHSKVSQLVNYHQRCTPVNCSLWTQMDGHNQNRKREAAAASAPFHQG